eukprot:662897-Rhodomonas_salina.1
MAGDEATMASDKGQEWRPNSATAAALSYQPGSYVMSGTSADVGFWCDGGRRRAGTRILEAMREWGGRGV